jgi:hypothetical protein
MHKYHAEHGGGPQHNNAFLHWPGTMDGFPIAGGQKLNVDLKQEEVENLDLQYDFKSQMFELWDEKQKAEFDEINDKIINGWYRLLKRSDHWAEEKNHFRVWLEWFQIYGMLPGKKGAA